MKRSGSSADMGDASSRLVDQHPVLADDRIEPAGEVILICEIHGFPECLYELIAEIGKADQAHFLGAEDDEIVIAICVIVPPGT